MKFTLFVLLSCALCMPLHLQAQQPTVHIQAPDSQGSRVVEKQTASSVIKGYLEGWTALQQALDLNQVSKLDPAFVGVARDKLTETIDSQSKLGIHTRYQALSHDLQIVFYSPEGLSIQLADNVEYKQEVLKKDTLLATAVVRRRYIVVLTPSETRWQIRIMQATQD